MTTAEKRQLVRRLQAGKRQARKQRPKRLRELKAAIAALNGEFRSLPEGHPRRIEIIRELEPLGRERQRLKWGGAS